MGKSDSELQQMVHPNNSLIHELVVSLRMRCEGSTTDSLQAHAEACASRLLALPDCVVGTSRKADRVARNLMAEQLLPCLLDQAAACACQGSHSAMGAASHDVQAVARRAAALQLLAELLSKAALRGHVHIAACWLLQCSSSQDTARLRTPGGGCTNSSSQRWHEDVAGAAADALARMTSLQAHERLWPALVTEFAASIGENAGEADQAHAPAPPGHRSEAGRPWHQRQQQLAQLWRSGTCAVLPAPQCSLLAGGMLTRRSRLLPPGAQSALIEVCLTLASARAALTTTCC